MDYCLWAISFGQPLLGPTLVPPSVGTFLCEVAIYNGFICNVPPLVARSFVVFDIFVQIISRVGENLLFRGTLDLGR